jgi:hypothetical protein
MPHKKKLEDYLLTAVREYLLYIYMYIQLQSHYILEAVSRVVMKEATFTKKQMSTHIRRTEA